MDATDRIGDRLSRPELVPPELRHLIPDDLARVEKILSIPVSGRVLDVGCSDGSITDRIYDKWPVFAVGADLRVHDTLDNRVCWDAREPFPYPEQFDAIYACEVFEHLTDADAQKALTNILAVLKPGGDLIVTVPNRFPHDLYEVGLRARWAWADHRSSWRLVKLRNFLAPHFNDLSWHPLYDHEVPDDSIWLIVHASGKK